MFDTGLSWAACSSSIVLVAFAFFVTGASFVACLCATSSCWFLVAAARVDRRVSTIVLIGFVNRNGDSFLRVYRALLDEFCLRDGCGFDAAWTKPLQLHPFARSHC